MNRGIYWEYFETPWILGARGAWDEGVTWRSIRTVAPTALPCDADYIRNDVLRVTNEAEQYHIQQLLWQVTELAEDATQRALMPQTWTMVLDRFPCHLIRLVRPPLLEAVSIAYVDGDGNTQTLTGSPAEFQVCSSGEMVMAELVPLPGSSWPATKTQRDAVTVTFRAGYATAAAVPYLIQAGIALATGELYKNRELSISGYKNNLPSVLKLDQFWARVW
jgi:uncharacterized phiE125 gp8 family phage protein